MLLALVAGLLLASAACTSGGGKRGAATRATPTLAPMQAGTPPALLCGGASGPACALTLFATLPDDGSGPFTARLDGATTSIDLSPFILDEPETAQALVRARARGVRVRVMTEPSHVKESADAYDALKAAGADVRETNPAFALTHAKYAIIDGHTALVLTFNLAARELTTRRDFALTDTTPADVQFLQSLFDADWERGTLGAIPPGFVLSPDNADDLLPAFVGSARQTLDVYAEKLEPSPLLDAIVAAAHRGVAVRIVAAGTQGRVKVPKPLGEAIRQGQAQIRVPGTVGVHAKVLLVDSAAAYFGSENIEDAVGDRRRELGVIFEDAGIAARIREVFERDWASPTNPKK